MVYYASNDQPSSTSAGGEQTTPKQIRFHTSADRPTDKNWSIFQSIEQVEQLLFTVFFGRTLRKILSRPTEIATEIAKIISNVKSLTVKRLLTVLLRIHFKHLLKVYELIFQQQRFSYLNLPVRPRL